MSALGDARGGARRHELRLGRCRPTGGLGLDGVMVTDPVDVRYLSGFRGEDATLVVGHKAALICADARFWEQVREEVTGFAAPAR